MRNTIRFSVLLLLASASAACLPDDEMPVASFREPDPGSVDPAPASDLSGLWKTAHASPALCPPEVQMWSSLKLSATGGFVASSSSGAVLSAGEWHFELVDQGDGTFTKAAFLDPAYGAYPTQLNSSTGQYLGGLITVDITGNDVCSWLLTLERD